MHLTESYCKPLSVLKVHWRLFVLVSSFLYFYRAMHFSAKRGIAIACRLSVCPSVRLSVCDVGGL